MGFLSDFFTGGVSGATNSAARVGRSGGIRQIEHLCDQIGWGIDERLGDSGIGLDFKDPIVGTRRLLVTAGEKIAILNLFSSAEFPARHVPIELALHLLQRNHEGIFHAWRMIGPEGGKVGFAAVYSALMEGLDPVTFKTICETLFKEVHAFDAKLRESGVI
ncbi:unnamed protein product [Gemmata massiliana]|uniref:Sensory transduction regulator n=1 Tax=Gemmata massiliana TaxID=1210884 RepID=A0A6P2D1W7_9BACT|nr:hypothetical protein [Gemmata massiliana]VTR93422.1 unnamed protein product [Gemmata massiliana]